MNMRNVLAMVLAGGRVDELGVLTMNRPKSAMPFGGVYRVIDFPLSNLMHSGIERVGILSQYRPFSLMNHIGNGMSWDMAGRNRYIHILPPFQGYRPSDWYRGTADAVYQNMDYIQHDNPSAVLILSGDHVYKMNYAKMAKFHQDRNADVTIAFKQVPWDQASRFGQGKMADESSDGGKLIEYCEKGEAPISNWASLTIYLFRAEVLYEIVESLVGEQKRFEFGRDIIPTILSQYKVYGYKFSGYWGYTRTITEYFTTSMSLLGDQPAIDPEEWKVRTNLAHRRIYDRPPAIVGSEAVIENSLIYNGCQIFGEVRNSILFPGVVVAPGALIKDSIVMFDSQILDKSAVLQAIIDTDVIVGPASVIGHSTLSHIDGASSKEIDEKELAVIGQEVMIPANVTLSPGCQVYPQVSEARFTKSYYEPLEVIR